LFGGISKRTNQLFMECLKVFDRNTLNKRRTESVQICFKDEETARSESPVDVCRVKLAVQETAHTVREPHFDLFR